MALDADISVGAQEVFAAVCRLAPLSLAALESAIGRECRDELDELEIEALVDAAGWEVVLTVWGGACAEALTGGRS